jgi:hypothetical protein
MQIRVTLTLGEQSRTFILRGRIGQTMHHLHRAGQMGITSLETPALRLSAYIHSLRRMGFEITTEREEHEGDYPGHHARYRLESIVKLEHEREGVTA